MKVRVLQYCPKVKDCVELTLDNAAETKLTFKGKVVDCNHKTKCYAWKDDGFCWIGHEITTGKEGAIKIGE